MYNAIHVCVDSHRTPFSSVPVLHNPTLLWLLSGKRHLFATVLHFKVGGLMQLNYFKVLWWTVIGAVSTTATIQSSEKNILKRRGPEGLKVLILKRANLPTRLSLHTSFSGQVLYNRSCWIPGSRVMAATWASFRCRLSVGSLLCFKGYLELISGKENWE